MSPLFLGKNKMPQIPPSSTKMNIRFNKALETFKHFSSKWDDSAREVLLMQIEKGLKEAKTGNKKVAFDYLMKALYERFHNDRDDQFYWGNKGQQYLGEAIHDFVPVAVLCQSKHLKQIRQFCREICPQKNSFLSLDIVKVRSSKNK